jgi:hypothetical protein
MKPEQITSNNKATKSSEGSKDYVRAGRPTKAQVILVYGEKGLKMTWAERAAAGVTAERFQEALAEKTKSRDQSSPEDGLKDQGQEAQAHSEPTSQPEKRIEILPEETSKEAVATHGRLEQGPDEKSPVAEEFADQSNAADLAEMDEEVFHCHEWSEQAHLWGEQADLALGRALNRVKSIVGHGNWQAYFAKRYAPRGLVLRTVQRYMQRAEEAEAKNVNSAFFAKATDDQANQVREANAQALAAHQDSGATQDKEGTVPPPPASEKPTTPRKSRPRPAGILWIPLTMTGAEKDATEELIADTEKWPVAEKRIMNLLRLLLTAPELDTSEVIPGTSEPVHDGPVPKPGVLSSKAAMA